jgi:gamma-glutamyltranspeptidase/glutathione hydrolase
MRRSLLALFLIAACSAPPKVTPPPLPPQAPADAGVAVPAVADAAVTPDAAVAVKAPPPRAYRTDTSTYGERAELGGTGKTFMVTSEDEHASKVGRDILAAGGNAVDAAVGVAFALAVTRPTAGNLGGGGFAVVRTATHKVDALDFREVAPAAATSDMYKAPTDSIIGPRAAGVPGSVAGLYAMHKKWGKKKWADVIAPAIELAKTGYQVSPYLASVLARRASMGPLTGEFAARFAPNGKTLEAGATVTNPELAVVLERIAKKGPDGFYKGDTAKAIATAMKTDGGLITEKDLASYKVQWRKPLTFGYRTKWLATMPPPSSGGIVLAMTANMLKDVDLAKAGWHSPSHVHWLVEVWRRAFAARNEVLGDPAYVKNIPVGKLTSQALAETLKKTITDGASKSADIKAPLEGNNTTNLCVVDSKGMAVALTTTLNTSFGSGYMVQGILFNNEMDDFATRPGQPNAYGLVQGVANKIEPGKRPLSSMSPTIVEDDKGALYMVVGAQGGPRIITAVWQTLSNVIDFNLPVTAAVAAPRVHHQHLPDDVVVEDQGLTKEADDALQAAGYTTVWNAKERIYAGANAIVKTDAGWAGGIDPRSGGGAALGDN